MGVDGFPYAFYASRGFTGKKRGFKDFFVSIFYIIYSKASQKHPLKYCRSSTFPILEDHKMRLDSGCFLGDFSMATPLRSQI